MGEDSDRSQSPLLVVDEKDPSGSTNTNAQQTSRSSYNHLKISPPITLLQEICSRNGFTPEYQLLSTEGSVHEPTFKIAVTVDDITVTASGQSKKKARHAAAKEAIEKLKLRKNLNLVGINFDSMMPIDTHTGKLNTTGTSCPVASTSSGQTNSDPSLIKSSYALANDEGNPVGKLQEICMKMRVNPPDYDTCGEEGLAHERMFFLTCSITSLNMTTTGKGRSKKLAKRQAAENMLTKLENSEMYDKSARNSKTANNGSAQPIYPSLNMDGDDSAHFVKSRATIKFLCDHLDCDVEYLRQEVSMIKTDNVNEDLFYTLFMETFIKGDETGSGGLRHQFDYITNKHCILKLLDSNDNQILTTFGNGTDNITATKDAVLKAYYYSISLMEPLIEKVSHLRPQAVGSY